MATDIINSVVINGDTYLIRKFDAVNGMVLLKVISGKLLPNFKGITAKDMSETDNADFAMNLISGIMESLSEDDIKKITYKCLRVCQKVMPAGAMDIVDKAGNYCIEGIEYDMALTLKLCGEALKWSFGGFFDENGLLSKLLTNAVG